LPTDRRTETELALGKIVDMLSPLMRHLHLARRVHPLRHRGQRTAVIHAYCGFDSRREICLFGRVFQQPPGSGRPVRDNLLGDLTNPPTKSTPTCSSPLPRPRSV
jgi:hypothetical protein